MILFISLFTPFTNWLMLSLIYISSSEKFILSLSILLTFKIFSEFLTSLKLLRHLLPLIYLYLLKFLSIGSFWNVPLKSQLKRSFNEPENNEELVLVGIKTWEVWICQSKVGNIQTMRRPRQQLRKKFWSIIIKYHCISKPVGRVFEWQITKIS